MQKTFFFKLYGRMATLKYQKIPAGKHGPVLYWIKFGEAWRSFSMFDFGFNVHKNFMNKIFGPAV